MFNRYNPNIVCPDPVSPDHEEELNENHMEKDIDKGEMEMAGGN